MRPLCATVRSRQFWICWKNRIKARNSDFTVLFVTFRTIWSRHFRRRYLRDSRPFSAFLDTQLSFPEISAQCYKFLKILYIVKCPSFNTNEISYYDDVINSCSTLPYYDIINYIKNHIIGLKVVLNAWGMCGLSSTCQLKQTWWTSFMGSTRGSHSYQMTIEAPSCQ